MQSSVRPRPFWRHASALLAIFLKAIRKPPRWFVALLFSVTAVLSVPSLAQAAGTMLFLAPSTNDVYYDNSWAAFSAQAAAVGLTPVNGRSQFSGAAPLSIPSDTKLVVVVTHNDAVSATRMTELTTIMSTRPDLAIVMFIDGCCQVPANLVPIVAALNTIKPAGWPIFTLGATVGTYDAPLNTASLYQSTFAAAGLTVFLGSNYIPILNVPLDYALYTETALPKPPPPIVTQNVVGLFIPQTASNGGKGACLFLMADSTQFSSGSRYSSQYTPIAQAFTNAATDPNGACAQPVSGAPDLWAELSEQTPLTIANPVASMTLTVGNTNQPGVTASTDGQVDVALPDGLTLVPGSLVVPAGFVCTPNAAGFSCEIPPLAPSDSPATLDFQVTAASPIPASDPVAITASVSQVTGEVNTGNNNPMLGGIFTADGSPYLTTQLTGDTELAIGAPATVTLTVSNSGEPGITASSPGTVEVTLPSDLELVAPPPAGCTANATGFTCAVDTLQPGDHATFDFQVVAPHPILADTAIVAEVTVPGNVSPNNGATTLPDISTIATPDLSATLEGPSNLPVGTPVTMTLTVSNSGEPGVATSPDGSTVTVTLPDGVNRVGALPAGCVSAGPANSFTCTLDAIAPGASAPPFEFQVIAPAPVSGGQIEVETFWDSGPNHASHRLLRGISAALPAPVPTLADLALALLALVIAGGAMARLQRKG